MSNVFLYTKYMQKELSSQRAQNRDGSWGWICVAYDLFRHQLLMSMWFCFIDSISLVVSSCLKVNWKIIERRKKRKEEKEKMKDSLKVICLFNRDIGMRPPNIRMSLINCNKKKFFARFATKCWHFCSYFIYQKTEDRINKIFGELMTTDLY